MSRTRIQPQSTPTARTCRSIGPVTIYITQLAAFVTINVTTKVGMRFMQCKPNTYASTGHHLFVNDRVNRCNINYNRCCPTGGDQQYCTERSANNKDFFDISNRRSNIKDMLNIVIFIFIS
jgi:hypothetical protein